MEAVLKTLWKILRTFIPRRNNPYVGLMVWMMFVALSHGAVQHKGAHREPPKIRGKSGKLYLVYPKKIPAPPGPAQAWKGSVNMALHGPLTENTQAPVPLWLVWESIDSVMLEWERNPETNIVGYRVYSGMEARLYSKVIEAGTNTTIVMPVVRGTNYFTVTAHNQAGREGAYAPEVHHIRSEIPQLRTSIARKPPASNPSGVFEVQSQSEVDKPWATRATTTNSFLPVTTLDQSFGKPYQFFRVRAIP